MANQARTAVVVSEHALFRHCLASILRDHGFHVLHEGPTVQPRHRGAEVTVVDLDHTSDDTMGMVRRLRRQLERSTLIVVGDPLRLAAASDDTADAEVETPHASAAALVAAARGRRTPRSSELRRAHRQWSAVTERQRDVLRWLGAGLDNAAIAARLGVGERAVKAHVSALLARFGCHSRTQLALLAQRTGIRPARP